MSLRGTRIVRRTQEEGQNRQAPKRGQSPRERGASQPGNRRPNDTSNAESNRGRSHGNGGNTTRRGNDRGRIRGGRGNRGFRGFWNVRGWNINTHTDNYNIRSLCVQELNLDIIGIAETHLTNNNVLELDGYKWFGNNRKNIHVRAKTGSGGVGFFIKAELLNYFDVSVLDDTSKGILWLKLQFFN